MGAAVQRRWPKNAERHRQETAEAAHAIYLKAREAREKLRRYPLSAELLMADIMAEAERIRRMMIEAKQGIE